MATVDYRDVSSGMLHLGVFDDGPDRVIRLAGELDLATAPALQNELDQAFAASPGTIVLDLSDLEFIDSTGIALIVKAMSDDDHDLRFVPSNAPAVERVLAVTGLDKRMRLTDGAGE